jgi:uncharacterized membrane protein
MDRIVNFFAFITVVVLGLSAGAMLTEAIVFVPFWQSLSPSEFLKWFAENEPLLVEFFGSLQTISVILILVTTVLFWLRNHRGKYLAAFALLLVIGVIALFFIYFQNVNASFVKATIAIDNVKSELAWWRFWQWVRTVLGIGAFVSAIFSIWRER